MRIEVPFQQANQLFIFSGALLACNLVEESDALSAARTLLSTTLEDAQAAHQNVQQADDSFDPLIVSLNKFSTETLTQSVNAALQLPDARDIAWRDNALEICASFSQAEAVYAL